MILFIFEAAASRLVTLPVKGLEFPARTAYHSRGNKKEFYEYKYWNH
ncbi:MAG: hypothetical protein ABR955_06210 [Verrucomicrobiota bacterium]|jgi:hypothetical protein